MAVLLRSETRLLRYSYLVLVWLGSLDCDRITGEYAAGWNRRGRSTTAKLSELISALAEPVILAADLKSLHICDGEQVHNSKSPRPRNPWNSFAGIEDHLLSIRHCQNRGPIAESVTVAEGSIRRFILVDGSCPNTIDDPQATVADDTFGDCIGEESEAGCRFVLQSGIGSSENLIGGEPIDQA